MPVKGEIHVCISTTSADATVRWLRGNPLPYHRGRPDTLLTPGYNAEAVCNLERLAAILSKVAKRKRFACQPLSVNIPRPLVEWFVGSAELWSLSPDVAAMLAAMRKAKQSRRGRPNLLPEGRLKRLAPNYIMIEDRQRKRLKRQVRADAALKEYLDTLRERGETFLTSSLPPPKI